MSRRLGRLMLVVFGMTGFAALTLQVVWQRVIALHAGVDLISFTTVVAAFLAGLGLGGLAGGALADRLGARGSLLAFAASNLGIALFAWVSLWLFYDVYADLAGRSQSPATQFAYNTLLLLVPTTLMGLSLPLVARGVVERIEEAGPLVGRLYAVNTVGAAAGAAVTGWLLLGWLGFEATVRVAGGLNLLASLIMLTLWRRTGNVAEAEEPSPAPEPPDPGPVPPATGARAWPWFAVYSLTGAVALGFELVFFRLVDAIMRSNSYSFAHVLTIYLVSFGAGSAGGSRLVARVKDPARWFLGLQYGIGLAALGGVTLMVQVAPSIGLGDGFLEQYFATNGFNIGFSSVDTGTERANLLFAYGVAPLLVMALPVVLMGAAFPFVQALVSERVTTLGRRTGTLFTANIAGNVTGTLVVGLLLVEWWGTATTMLVLAGLLVVPGLVAAWRDPAPRRRPALAGAAFGLMALLHPSNAQLWAFLHGVPDYAEFSLAEDRSCVTAVKRGVAADGFSPDRDHTMLYINASSQNGYPWDDFHVLIGMVPALVHPDPERAAAVGLGMGGTTYGIAADPRLDQVDTVELCGGEIDLLRQMADDGAFELANLFRDDRVDLRTGDGREFLLATDDRFDVITVDTLRSQSAFSGNLYSVEFYELIRERLSDDGLLAQWAPTPRTLNSVAEAFPYVVGFSVEDYSSLFFLASASPIDYDPAAVQARFERIPDATFSPEQHARLADYLAAAQPVCFVDGEPTGQVNSVNRDLAPRDEYFLNNRIEVPAPLHCGEEAGPV